MSKIDFSGFMHRKKIGQAKLAKLLGVTQQTVSMYCTGKSGITFDKIVKLIEMGITSTELFGEKDGKRLLENSGAVVSDADLEAKVVSVMNKVFNSGTIQIGGKG